MNKLFLSLSIIFSVVFSVNGQESGKNLLSERAGFKTVLKKLPPEEEALNEPESSLFSLVEYPTPIGKMKAYLSKPQDPKKKNPAIIWITGGFPVGGAGSYVWEDADNENDQSAQVYRKSGIVMMYPSFRGYAGNPGQVEGFYGEVNDVLSSFDYLSKLDFVDSKQIYLGGHSTGGTLALLTASATDKFKAVFAFGPTKDPAGYGDENEKHTNSSVKERRLRAPINFLKHIKVPTYVLEGESGNSASVLEMKKASKNKNIVFSVIKDADHFNVLWPLNRLFAQKIKEGKVNINEREMQSSFQMMLKMNRQADDLSTLSYIRRTGVNLTEKQLAQYYMISRNKDELDQLQEVYKGDGVKTRKIQEYKDSEGAAYYVLIVEKEVNLIDLRDVFSKSTGMAATCKAMGIQYNGWSVGE